MQNLKIYFGVDDGASLLDDVKIAQWVEIIDYIEKNSDSVYILDYVHYLTINGESIYSKIIGNTTEKKYLLQLLGRHKKETLLDKEELSEVLESASYFKPCGAFGEMIDIQLFYPQQYLLHKEDLEKVKIYYLKQKKDFSQLEVELRTCFKGLYFNRFNWNPFTSDDISEIVTDLEILQNYAMEIYEKNGRQGGEALKELKGKFNCSGAESAGFSDLVDIDGQDVSINYSPHIKLGRSDSNKRIYFAWGNDKKKNKIVVYLIGGHCN